MKNACGNSKIQLFQNPTITHTGIEPKVTPNIINFSVL